MKIALCQIDGKYPNIPLMKLSTYHKNQGDSIDWFSPFNEYNTIYASKVFTNTPDNLYLPDNTIRGGSGYDLKTVLPSEAEKAKPDYSLYPAWDKAIGFTTRGCPRKCSYCIVPKKEGGIKVTGDIYDFWEGQKKLILLDNNLTAAPFTHFKKIVDQLIKENIKVDFSQGLDIRLVTPEIAELLVRVKTFKQIHFAFDHPRYEKAVTDGIKMLINNGVSRSRLMFYVLTGYDTTIEEDYYRVDLLRDLGVDPFVMPYDKSDPIIEAFAAWVNSKAVFKTIPRDTYIANRTKNKYCKTST